MRLFLAGLVFALPLMAQADTVLFQEDFSGTGPLNGTTPDLTTGGAAWVAGPAFKADGTVGALGENKATATLAFTPEANNVYRLQATIHSIADWMGFGFANGQSDADDQKGFNASPVLGRAWFMKSADPSQNLTQQTGNNNSLAFPGTFATSVEDMDFRVDLNTSDATWTVIWYGKLTTDSEYTLFRAEENLTSQDIDSIGFSSREAGTITDFSLSLIAEDTQVVSPRALTVTPTNVTVNLPGHPGNNYTLERATNVMFSAGVSNFSPTIAPPSGWVTNVDDFADLYGAPNMASPPAAFYRMHNNEPMNVVLLLADDWRFDSLGVAGNAIVQTPRLNTLAAEGMRFTQACVTTPICSASRACIYTGQWASRNGTTGFEMFDTPWSQTYPGLLRDNGYWVGHVGKWHNGTFPSSQYDFGREYKGKHWYTVDGVYTHVTDRNENDALEFLRTRPGDKPFYLTVAFFAPHAEDKNELQYLPQPEYTNLYENLAIPIPVNATDESFNRLPSFLATETNEGRIRWHRRFDTPEKFQTMMKNYYRLCTGVDTACGRILDELQAQGVLDNTLIIFIGDNGYYHAEHGLADKWYPHQESIRVPLIIRDPRMTAPPGQTNDAFVLNVDLAPTILSATGIGAPSTMQGRDITPLYTGKTPVPAWRTEFYEEHFTISNINRIPASRALVRKDWKYMYWPNFDTEQLFDLINDPIEENDLANDPAHQAKLIEMRQRFSELQAEAQ